MNLLIIFLNCFLLIVSAQEDSVATATASASTSAEAEAEADSSSWAPSNDFKPRIAAKVWNECGTSCPLTCAQPERRPCNFMCNPGWFCPKDYYENSDGQCVLLEDCDSDSTKPKPPKHLPGHIVGRPRPRPRPGPRPRPRPRPIGISDDLGQFPKFPNFPNFNSSEIEFPKFPLPIGPPRPQPTFQIDPVGYNATAVANGAPIAPPALIRTSGSNLPSIGFSMVPKVKPLIDLDPTVPRPVLRVSQEQSSDK